MQTIAIIGRTNVGKSTLFNRLIGRKKAIVHNRAGVTRDRREGMGTLLDLNFKIIDTAGLEETGELAKAMWEQTEIAIDDADILLYMIDAKIGITPQDKKLASFLRKKNKPTILIANKSEGKNSLVGITEGYNLALSDPIPVSAEHGEGMDFLYFALKNYIASDENAKLSRRQRTKQTLIQKQRELHILNSQERDSLLFGVDENQRKIKIAVIGRPNVGKSTLVNQLLGENRVLTGELAGLTRDSIAIPFTYNGQELELIDTAGLRRQSHRQDELEKLSAADTKRSAFLAQIVILVLDANAILEKQDLNIAAEVLSEGRALIIAVNKWDIVHDKKETMDHLHDRLETSLHQIKGIPTVNISAKSGFGIDKLMKTIFTTYAKWNKRIATGPLNRWLEEATQYHPTPLASNGRHIPIKYITQIKSRPPAFVIFSSNPDKLPESYNRYLINGIRDNFDLSGVPIRLTIRRQKNPFDKG